MIRVKYWVSWALVGLLPKHKYSLFHFIVLVSAQKIYNICETEYGNFSFYPVSNYFCTAKHYMNHTGP